MQTINLSKLASLVNAYHNCVKSNNTTWINNHEDSINEMCKLLPHGSGIDGKCQIQLENCKNDKLCFFVEFHHMNNTGYYTGWTEHNIIITPSLQFGFNIKITGINKNDIKTYLTDVFSDVFSFNTNNCPVS